VEVRKININLFSNKNLLNPRDLAMAVPFSQLQLDGSYTWGASELAMGGSCLSNRFTQESKGKA
jgi:hypothetical protein